MDSVLAALASLAASVAARAPLSATLTCLLALAVGAVLRWGGLDCMFTASPFAIKTAPTGLAVLVTDTAPSPAWRWCSGALHPGRRPGAGCGPWRRPKRGRNPGRHPWRHGPGWHDR